MKYTLGNTVHQEDTVLFYTEIYEGRTNGPALMYAQIFGLTKDESRERALAIIAILKAASSL